jgi:hypothetical protein
MSGPALLVLVAAASAFGFFAWLLAKARSRDGEDSKTNKDDFLHA